MSAADSPAKQGRFKRLKIDAAELCSFVRFMAGVGDRASFASFNLPADVVVVAAYGDFQTGTINLLLTSSAFEPVAEGAHAPFLDAPSRVLRWIGKVTCT